MHQFVEDSGHGWLRVPRVELDALNVAHRITTCSYVDGDSVWLEEDCDLSTYLHARVERDDTDVARFFADHVKVTHVAGDAWIRNLPRYEVQS